MAKINGGWHRLAAGPMTESVSLSAVIWPAFMTKSTGMPKPTRLAPATSSSHSIPPRYNHFSYGVVPLRLIRVRNLAQARHTVVWSQPTLRPSLPPDQIEHRIYQQFHQKGRCQPADHRGGDSLHQVRAGPCGPENRQQPDCHRGDGHELRPDPLGRTLQHHLLQIGGVVQAPAERAAS